MQSMITAGLLRNGKRADDPNESFTAAERRVHWAYSILLQMVPGLEDKLMMDTKGDSSGIVRVAEAIQKGANSTRSDDTKSLKGPILDWITPPDEVLSPPLSRNIKWNRGFNHNRTGALLCPFNMDWTDPDVKAKLKDGEVVIPGDCWPLFLFAGFKNDSEEPWSGLFKSTLLVKAYKHIFTSPSSVEKVNKATQSGNAQIHGMSAVTAASIAYIATQVRFALSSASVFSRTNRATDSARFYYTVLDYFDYLGEEEYVRKLLVWWNRQIFPVESLAQPILPEDSFLAVCRKKRAEKKAAQATAALRNRPN